MKIIASAHNPVGYERELRELNALGYRIDWIRQDSQNEIPLADRMQGYPFIIAGGEVYDDETLKRLADRGLKLIARLGVGYDRIDIDAARRYGVRVANTPGANAHTVAEHALMLTMAAARGAGLNNQQMHEGVWNVTRVTDLWGATFGLVGFGHIAQAYARLIRPLAGRILAYDPAIHPTIADELGVLPVPLHEVLGQSDVVSLHLPLTEETRGMFGASSFSAMKDGGVFINTSRGEIVDEAALCDALRSGKLLGAGLDVYESEPISPTSPLCGLRNCFMTPHNASMSDAAFRAMMRLVAENLLAYITGEGDVHDVYA